jgi:hypothetical protein
MVSPNAMPFTILKGLIAGVIVFAVIHLLALFWAGVWLPDIGSTTPRTIALARLPGGDELRVVQYWNHVDFYTTELRHTARSGQQQIYVLDADDSKSWSIPLWVDPQQRTASVTLSGERKKTVSW